MFLEFSFMNMYVTTTFLSFLTVTFSCNKEKFVKLQQQQQQKMKSLKMQLAVFTFLVGFATATSLILDERMDLAAQDPKGM